MVYFVLEGLPAKNTLNKPLLIGLSRLDYDKPNPPFLKNLALSARTLTEDLNTWRVCVEKQKFEVPPRKVSNGTEELLS